QRAGARFSPGIGGKDRLHEICHQDDPSRRELNMNAGNPATLLFLHEFRARRSPAPVTAKPPAARQAQSAAYRGESEASTVRGRPRQGVQGRLWVGFSARAQLRKNTNQITPRIRIASPVETVSSAATEGPSSPWRASVGVSTV